MKTNKDITVEIIYSKEFNRANLKFSGIPSEECRTEMKKEGWMYSKNHNVWYPRNEAAANSLYFANNLKQKYYPDNQVDPKEIITEETEVNEILTLIQEKKDVKTIVAKLSELYGSAALVAALNEIDGNEENVEKDVSEIADLIIQQAYEQSASGFNYYMEYSEVARLAGKTVEWVEQHIEVIDQALMEHNDNELLDYNSEEGHEEPGNFNFNFCSIGEDANELFKFENNRWIRKTDEELIKEGLMDKPFDENKENKPQNRLDEIIEMFENGPEGSEFKVYTNSKGLLTVEILSNGESVYKREQTGNIVLQSKTFEATYETGMNSYYAAAEEYFEILDSIQPEEWGSYVKRTVKKESLDIKNEPYVLLKWSESPVFPDENKVYSIKEFNELLTKADKEKHNRKEYAITKYGSYENYIEAEKEGKIPEEDKGIDFGYDKTSYQLFNLPNLTNHSDTYSYTPSRYDIGDGNGSLFDDIRATCSYDEIIRSMNLLEVKLYQPNITVTSKQRIDQIVEEENKKLIESLKNPTNALEAAVEAHKELHKNWMIEQSKENEINDAISEALNGIKEKYETSMANVFKQFLTENTQIDTTSIKDKQTLQYLASKTKQMLISNLYLPSREAQKSMNNDDTKGVYKINWDTQRKIWDLFPARCNIQEYTDTVLESVMNNLGIAYESSVTKTEAEKLSQEEIEAGINAAKEAQAAIYEREYKAEEGKNYDSNLSTTEIAKKLRDYIKVNHPGYKFSVKSHYFSGGSEISVNLKKAPVEITNENLMRSYLDEESKKATRIEKWDSQQGKYIQYFEMNEEEKKSFIKEKLENTHYMNITRHSTDESLSWMNPEVKTVMLDVVNTLESYNFDHSDSQSDYFFVNFYSNYGISKEAIEKSIELSNSMNKNEKISIETELLTDEDLSICSKVVPKEQLEYTLELTKGEEGAFFTNKLKEIADTYRKINVNHELVNDDGTHNVGFRYFLGDTEIFISEIDSDGNGFGYNILNGDLQMSEWGSTSLEKILSIPYMEMDYHVPEGITIEKMLYQKHPEYFTEYAPAEEKIEQKFNNDLFEKEYVKDKPATFRYELLARMQSDCDYYIGKGNRSAEKLWSRDEVSHIKNMISLFNSFSFEDKPEWLTIEQLSKYTKELTGKTLEDNGWKQIIDENNVFQELPWWDDDISPEMEKRIDSGEIFGTNTPSESNSVLNSYTNEIIEKIKAAGINVVIDKDEINWTKEHINEVNITLEMLGEKPLTVQEGEKKEIGSLSTSVNDTLSGSQPLYKKYKIDTSNSQDIINNLVQLNNIKTKKNGEEFLTALKQSFYLDNYYSSNYVHNKNIELRLSNHCADAIEARRYDKATSIVIKLVRGKDAPRFRKSPEADVIEFAYYPENITLESEREIVRGLIDWVKTGVYTYTKSDEFHQSTRKDLLNKKIEKMTARTGLYWNGKPYEYTMAEYALNSNLDMKWLNHFFGTTTPDIYQFNPINGGFQPQVAQERLQALLETAERMSYTGDTVSSRSKLGKERLRTFEFFAEQIRNGNIGYFDRGAPISTDAPNWITVNETKIIDEPEYMFENGLVVGLAYENNIVLNPDYLSSNAAVHEYTHLWDTYTQKTNPELWNKGLEIFKDTKYWNEVISDPNYQDIKDDENLVLSEIHSRICGDVAEKVLERIAELDGEQVKLDAIDWDKEVWNYIAFDFNFPVSTDIAKDVHDFLSTPMKDLMASKNITISNDLTGKSLEDYDSYTNEIIDKIRSAGIEVITESNEYSRIKNQIENTEDPKQYLKMDWVSEKEIDYKSIKTPDDVIPLLSKYNKSPQEVFVSITLDTSHNPISSRIISVGTINRALVHPREVFREAIKDNAAAIIVAHNHPSGNISPSEADIETTKKLVDAGSLIGIQVLDHIITAPDNPDYYSFRKNSLIQSMKEQGITYGFVWNNKMYLDPDLMSPKVTVHEYTHLWDAYTQKTNPELWKKGFEIFKDTKYWNEVISDPNYQDIKDDDNLVLSEIHSRICGDMADWVLEHIADLDGEETKLDAIEWNNDTWMYISIKLFNNIDFENKEQITALKDFLSTPIMDLMEGKNISSEATWEEIAHIFRYHESNGITKSFEEIRAEIWNDNKPESEHEWKTETLSRYLDDNLVFLAYENADENNKHWPQILEERWSLIDQITDDIISKKVNYTTQLEIQSWINQKLQNSELYKTVGDEFKRKNNYNFFVNDTANLDLGIGAEIEPITGLTAEQAMSKYAELKDKGLSPYIGLNIPGDIVFDDEEGQGAGIFCENDGKPSFYIGDHFVKGLKQNDEHAKNVIAAYKDLYERAAKCIQNVEKPVFVFNKENELNNPKNPLKVYSFSPFGYEGSIVTVETDLRRGIPATDIVGIADSLVKETRERIQKAFLNSDLDYPSERVLQSLSPADTRKETPMDLAMALSILGQTKQYSVKEPVLAIGYLDFMGNIQPVRGAVAAVNSAKAAGITNIICDPNTAELLKDIEGIKILSAWKLKEVDEKLLNIEAFQETEPKLYNAEKIEFNEEEWISELLSNLSMEGKFDSVRALEIAVAGKHNIIATGTPDSGKEQLAHTLIAALTPKLTAEETESITRINSLAGLDSSKHDKFVSPIRMPHQAASLEGMIGGGINCRPGEISLAHNGTLFMDDAVEFRTAVIQSVRVPLENRQVTLSRAGRHTIYPADFQLALTMNPCPCGNYGSNERICLDSARVIEAYWKKVSAPLMERVEIKAFVDKNGNDKRKVTIEQMKSAIANAYEIQRKRGVFNSHLNKEQISQYCKLNEQTKAWFEEQNAKQGEISPLTIENILKTSLTIANMEGREKIHLKDLQEAYGYCMPGNDILPISRKKYYEMNQKQINTSHIRATEINLPGYSLPFEDIPEEMREVQIEYEVNSPKNKQEKRSSFSAENDDMYKEDSEKQFLQKQKETMSHSKGWDNDFPTVYSSMLYKDVKRNPELEELRIAAKAGDKDKAFEFVQNVVNFEMIESLKSKYPDAIICHVHAEEASGLNKIPVAYKSLLADYGFETTDSIVQTVTAHHTGANNIKRLVNRVRFEGDVKKGRDYILVDDHADFGGTLRDLKDYIETNGGNVVAFSTLTTLEQNTRISPTRENLEKLNKYGGKVDELLEQYGITDNKEGLTNGEINGLLQVLADTSKDRSFEAGFHRSFSVLCREIQQDSRKKARLQEKLIPVVNRFNNLTKNLSEDKTQKRSIDYSADYTGKYPAPFAAKSVFNQKFIAKNHFMPPVIRNDNGTYSVYADKKDLINTVQLRLNDEIETVKLTFTDKDLQNIIQQHIDNEIRNGTKEIHISKPGYISKEQNLVFDKLNVNEDERKDLVKDYHKYLFSFIGRETEQQKEEKQDQIQELPSADIEEEGIEY